jgi:putative ABC transport system permease protein
LLIACVNLANLMLVRSSVRQRELLIRSALGASRWRLARAVMVESLMLSLAGASLGGFAAWFAVETFRATIPAEVPRTASIAVDTWVLIVTMAIAIAVGILVSLPSIVQLWRPANEFALTPSSRGHTSTPAHRWLRGALVVAEVVLGTVLLIGAGLFLASFARVTSVDLGFDPNNVLAVRVRPYGLGEDPIVAARRYTPLHQQVLEEVRRLPGVETAALVNAGLPLRGDLRTVNVAIPGREVPKGETIAFNAVSPDYFTAMRIPLLRGRLFTDADRPNGEAVMLIDDTAARKYFPGEDPVGHTMRFSGMRRIVGVVGSVRHDGPEHTLRRQGFIPFSQSVSNSVTLVMRLAPSVQPAHVLPAVKSAVWRHFPGLALPDIETLSQYLRDLTAARRFNMLLLGLFGLLGLVIACVGIYGVISYVVALRTPEIGIRTALGAAPTAILWSVLRMAVFYLVGGLAIGLPAAWSMSTLVASFLFEVQPRDLWIYAVVVGVLTTTGLLAALPPARRAARVDPVIALRLE